VFSGRWLRLNQTHIYPISARTRTQLQYVLDAVCIGSDDELLTVGRENRLVTLLYDIADDTKLGKLGTRICKIDVLLNI
jgi:hypothetical protein